MSNSTSEKPAFHIGLAMAGAVSAGAYSAGVFDFLMEALSEWEKTKARGDDVAKHDVFISAISGTSAGGITAALGLAALAGGVRAVETPAANPNPTHPVRRVLPELYDVWVKNTKLFAGRDETKKSDPGDGHGSLLDIGDLRPGKLPVSLLNSEMLTRTARATLSSIRPTGARFPFFTDPTHLFLTHTNLDGIPYPIAFESEESVYWMSLHEDRAHFAVKGLGEREFPKECKWLTDWKDLGDEIDVADMGKLQGARQDQPLPEPQFEALAQAALTTSAFPFGLRARHVSTATAVMRRRALPFHAGQFPAALEQTKPPEFPTAHFVCVDGGTLNNEPFELVRWTIRDLDETQNARDPTKANRAVILIAPFPPESKLQDSIKEAREEDTGLAFVARMLLPALIGQARFKASDLIAASDPDVYSRFLISPKRSPKPEPAPPDNTPVPDLACGLLYAFGGFLDEQFREHDFRLGRRNCQWFLRNHFTLSPENPVLGLQGRGIADGDPPPIIPLVGTANEPVEAPPWPRLPEEKLADLRAALERRLDPMIAQSARALLKDTPILQFVARLSWRRRRREVVDKIMQIVRDELVKNGQLRPLERRRRLWSRVKRWFGFGRAAPLAVGAKVSS